MRGVSMVNPKENSYLFKPVQFMGQPAVIPPLSKGKIATAVQFIVPGLRLKDSDKKKIFRIAQLCERELYSVDAKRIENNETKEQATLFTFAFYINNNIIGKEKNDIIYSLSRLLVERFLCIFSFISGIKLCAVNIQPTIVNENGSYSQILHMANRTEVPKITIDIPDEIDAMNISSEVFSALFWLRRGLAERDPIENFSSLMVCLQIIARYLSAKQPIAHYCPSCGIELETLDPSITAMMRELVVTKLNASPDLFEKLWKARNAITSHGNRPVTPEVFIELTELKFDAIELAFKSVKLSLGLPLNFPISPNQMYFVTDAFMYVD